MVAHQRRETRNFFQVALAAALEAEDWPRVRGCRARMEELDRALLSGRRIRAGVAPAPGGLEDPLFLAAAEGKRACGLEAIKLEDGSITRDPALIEAKVTRYFEALFQGRHAVGSGNSVPSDSGPPFQPKFDRLRDFLVGLPRLSVDESALLDLPVNVPDLEEAVKAASAGRSPGLDGLSYEFYKAVFGWVGQMASTPCWRLGSWPPPSARGSLGSFPRSRGCPSLVS
jgi:hypothetical protein